MFDKQKKGFIYTSQIGQILRTMGQAFEDRDLKQLIKEFDADGTQIIIVITIINFIKLYLT